MKCAQWKINKANITIIMYPNRNRTGEWNCNCQSLNKNTKKFDLYLENDTQMFLKVYVPQRMLRVERKLYSACLNKWKVYLWMCVLTLKIKIIVALLKRLCDFALLMCLFFTFFQLIINIFNQTLSFFRYLFHRCSHNSVKMKSKWMYISVVDHCLYNTSYNCRYFHLFFCLSFFSVFFRSGIQFGLFVLFS